MLAKLLKKSPDYIRLSEEPLGSTEDPVRVAEQFGLEGLVA
jgi:hypothetical protein